MRDNRIARLAFLGMPSVYLLLFFVLPLVSMAVLAFWRTENYHIIREANFGNFHTLLVEPAYQVFLLRSVVMAVAVSAICTGIAWPVAYAIMVYGGRYKLLFTLALAVPFLTGEVLRVIALQGLLGPMGLINAALMHMGAMPLRFLMYSNIASAIGLVYLYLPIAITVIYLSLLNFDARLADAARIFGAGPVRTFFEITWPLNLFGTLISVVLCFIPCLSTTLVPRFLGGPDGTLFGMALAQQFAESGTWALGAAMGVILFIVSISVTLLMFRIDLRRAGFSGMGRA
ncbi:hypothetical protein AYJ57_20490 (plasmid) [Salipiger sp. CCB-MM3]|uniref:ABC transporter permease n=1 Tax=Salipiger sp. CCB-MM3 TaxID=1792508 RepID=UPI00080AB6F7|nr:ABC transporter permease [Salipiger sp. CCB-MM3]ANT62867.1 hypothetical protein AYJ57_20490 [Salipiger sp. CCB-MM3]